MPYLIYVILVAVCLVIQTDDQEYLDWFRQVSPLTYHLGECRAFHIITLGGMMSKSASGMYGQEDSLDQCSL